MVNLFSESYLHNKADWVKKSFLGTDLSDPDYYVKFYIIKQPAAQAF